MVDAQQRRPRVFCVEDAMKWLYATAALHHLRPDVKLTAGDRIKVSGMIVDQWYAVWQIWCYNIERLK